MTQRDLYLSLFSDSIEFFQRIRGSRVYQNSPVFSAFFGIARNHMIRFGKRN